MKPILFLHDTGLSLRRGAELTLNQLIAAGRARGLEIAHDRLRDFDSVRARIADASLLIVNSTSRCPFELELLKFIIDCGVPYIKVEYDYNFCVRRNILCTVDRNVRLCCHTDKFHLYRELFASSRLNIFQSPAHYQSHKDFYGEAVANHLIMPPTVEVELLKISKDKSELEIPFFGELNYLKGGDAYLDFALENPHKLFPVYGENKLRREISPNVVFFEPVTNAQVLEILGRTKYFFCEPVWPEPSGRLAAEAFLSGCEIISNDRIGTFSFDWFPNDPARAAREMRDAPEMFWNRVMLATGISEPRETLGNVLIYKSYGGLGDIFFCLPSLYMMKEISQSVTFAVSGRLVKFFGRHLTGIAIIDEEIARSSEARFDQVIELGNYPAFRGYGLPHAIRYATHKRVKQHAIGHYLDALQKFHPSANRNQRFPYFNREPDFENPYYTLHPGAGFLLKIWPTQNYARLIEMIREAFPTLRCRIILGPEDPDPADYMAGDNSYIEYERGGMMEVGASMAGALFHIGNDAGITHVAGAFNVPTVGIYGPTGPGSWGCFSEFSEVIWGKSGNCSLRCNYDVILNCANRVCLSSVTPQKVLGGLYRLLQRAYPEIDSVPALHPAVTVDLTDLDCMLTLDKNEFVVNFTNDVARTRVSNLIAGDYSVLADPEMQSFAELLRHHGILVSIPKFPGTKKATESVA